MHQTCIRWIVRVALKGLAWISRVVLKGLAWISRVVLKGFLPGSQKYVEIVFWTLCDPLGYSSCRAMQG